MLNRAQFRFRLVLQSAGRFIHNIGNALAKVSTDGNLYWLLWALGVSILSLVVGRFLGARLNIWARDTFADSFVSEPKERSTKIKYLLFRSIVMILTATVASAFAAFVVWVIAYNYRETLVTGFTVVGVFFAVRVTRAVMFNIIVPDVPNYRLFNFEDETAQSFYRALIGIMSVAAAMLGICLWMEALGLDLNSHKLALIIAGALIIIMFIGLYVRYRTALTQVILGPGVHGYYPLWRRAISKIWLPGTIIYLVSAYCVAVIRLLLDLPSANGLVFGPLLVAVVVLALFGVGLIIIDWYFDPRPAQEQKSGEQAAEIELVEGEIVAADEEAAEAHLEEDYNLGLRPIFKRLVERGYAILLTFAGIGVIMELWGFDFENQANPALNFLDIILVSFAGYMAYQAVKIWTDYQIAMEEPVPAHGGDGGEAEMGVGQSRLATLLPIFRNFLLITIVTIAGMIVLAEMGVDIAPLFAGAGVIGLAVGFGAQTLIRDVFSGAFFLMDDAFRKGEYIDLGEVKGTVEKISIRSFQLRHHNGPLNTVPFGEIRFLKNFSRDWVMMKLKLRVTYDTDVEKVRKLVKKLGQELLEHPEIGPMFLQPLKSQGVYAMEDSAMIIRVKFMTKPGDQFMTRKFVYARIQELFEQNGIKFAHRQVTVRIAEEDQDRPEDEKRKAATGAAQAALDDGQQPAPT
ncbi:MAG: mechanosensitive ion channel family protein [Alphaproteobacteria bacterium]|nr:mechanosensitive ion channel family protein [Alphaproteobacteria bacterium]